MVDSGARSGVCGRCPRADDVSGRAKVAGCPGAWDRRPKFVDLPVHGSALPGVQRSSPREQPGSNWDVSRCCCIEQHPDRHWRKLYQGEVCGSGFTVFNPNQIHENHCYNALDSGNVSLQVGIGGAVVSLYSLAIPASPIAGEVVGTGNFRVVLAYEWWVYAVACNTTTLGNTSTTGSESTDGVAGNDHFYAFDAPIPGSYTISTCGSVIDPTVRFADGIWPNQCSNGDYDSSKHADDLSRISRLRRIVVQRKKKHFGRSQSDSGVREPKQRGAVPSECDVPACVTTCHCDSCPVVCRANRRPDVSTCVRSGNFRCSHFVCTRTPSDL
eukprot:m.27688 g.27688  ORF g.27688 m.27688 type:complete len:328 (+) comp6457_c0_seq1:173-1156(+)